MALIRKCDENKPREREFNASLKLSALQKEMDVPKPNFGWLASQLRSGAVKGDDPFENVYRRTLLHLMVIAGDIEMVEVCFAAGADPKKRDCFGLLPFHLAIVHGHLKLLQNMLPVMRAFGQSVHTPENAAGMKKKMGRESVHQILFSKVFLRCIWPRFSIDQKFSNGSWTKGQTLTTRMISALSPFTRLPLLDLSAACRRL